MGDLSPDIIFLSFHTVHGVLMTRIYSDLPFHPPMDHVLSDLTTMTHPSWVALDDMAQSFIEFCKPLPNDEAEIHGGHSSL